MLYYMNSAGYVRYLNNRKDRHQEGSNGPCTYTERYLKMGIQEMSLENVNLLEGDAR